MVINSYCNDCDVEWEHDVDPYENTYVAICPECKYEYEKELNLEDYDPRGGDSWDD